MARLRSAVGERRAMRTGLAMPSRAFLRQCARGRQAGKGGGRQYGACLSDQSHRCLQSAGAAPLLNTYRGWAGDNEFEKKRSYEEFVTQDAVRLRAIAPKLPLTVVLTGRLGLESYDMARKAFPLNSSGGPMQLFDAPHSVGPQFALPDSLPVDVAAAEDVLQRMENRNLWMAATVTITRIGQQTGDISYRLERLVGYADRGLTDLVYEFPRAQAPVAGSEGESLAASESVPLMGDTLLLAAINAGLPPARPIDWVQETRLRFGLERSIYRIDHGANWKQHDPWGPFFPASAQPGRGRKPHMSNGRASAHKPFPKILLFARWERYAFPEPVLQPVEPKARARMNQIVSIADGYIYPHLVWGLYVELVSKAAEGEPPDDSRVALAWAKAPVCLDVLAGFLGDSPWLAGDHITLADLYVAPMLDYFLLAPEGQEMFSAKTNLVEWWDRMNARESFQITRRSR